MTLLEPGARISDTLVVDRPLGEGAFAEVYRVEHRFLGRQAMKLFKRVASGWETRALLAEARLLSTLGHPNIIRLFDAGTVPTADGVRGWFTMEYMPGGTLERFAAAHRPAVPAATVAEATAQIAAGLAVAHGREPPILHRDLTPANVLVGYDGAGLRVRISDFGLARHADPFTRLASAQGTYAFMAPEVLRGDACSAPADVWSVGAIAYLLLTDHLPFGDGRTYAPASTARFAGRLLPPSAYNETVDAALDAAVTAALDLAPGDRPSAAGLRDVLRARPAPGRPAAPAERPPGERALRLVEEAFAMSRIPGRLDRAADLLEEAVTLSPRIAAQHVDLLTLWRRGVLR